MKAGRASSKRSIAMLLPRCIVLTGLHVERMAGFGVWRVRWREGGSDVRASWHAWGC